jgi:hypothetical protein
MAHFVVISEQGPAWNPDRPMRDQGHWSEHASFMNSLVDQGFVVLGGQFTTRQCTPLGWSSKPRTNQRYVFVLSQTLGFGPAWSPPSALSPGRSC